MIDKEEWLISSSMSQFKWQPANTFFQPFLCISSFYTRSQQS
jgi:hypothetical protein